MSRRFPAVLVDQAAETIATPHGAVAAHLVRRRLEDGKLEASMGPARVVVRRELPEDTLEVASAQDQQDLFR